MNCAVVRLLKHAYLTNAAIDRYLLDLSKNILLKLRHKLRLNWESFHLANGRLTNHTRLGTRPAHEFSESRLSGKIVSVLVSAPIVHIMKLVNS